MVKIEQLNQSVKNQPNNTKDTSKLTPQASGSQNFSAEISKTLEKMEGIASKLKTNMAQSGEKISTSDIINDVKQARAILEELTKTFSSIDQSSTQSKVVYKDAAESIKKYDKAANNQNNQINSTDRKIT